LHAVIIAAEEKLDFARDMLDAIRRQDGRRGMSENLNRRAALGALASVPALASCPPFDPVFAAIARHKVAWAAFVETCDPLDNVEGEQEGTKEELAYIEANAAADGVPRDPADDLGGAARGPRICRRSGCLPDNGGRIAATLLRSPLFAGMNGEGFADV
jgi:hypothetical protein